MVAVISFTTFSIVAGNKSSNLVGQIFSDCLCDHVLFLHPIVPSLLSTSCQPSYLLVLCKLSSTLRDLYPLCGIWRDLPHQRSWSPPTDSDGSPFPTQCPSSQILPPSRHHSLPKHRTPNLPLRTRKRIHNRFQPDLEYFPKELPDRLFSLRARGIVRYSCCV